MSPADPDWRISQGLPEVTAFAGVDDFWENGFLCHVNDSTLYFEVQKGGSSVAPLEEEPEDALEAVDFLVVLVVGGPEDPPLVGNSSVAHPDVAVEMLVEDRDIWVACYVSYVLIMKFIAR
jgi:hypothetical protein